MDFDSQKTLAYSSVVAVTVALYRHVGFEGIEKEEKYKHGWPVVRDKVLNNATLLPLPEYVKDYIKDTVSAIGKEVSHWVMRNTPALEDWTSLWDKISWTPLGLIDSKKTAMNFLEGGNLDDVTTFHLAASHCMEKKAFPIWRIVKERLTMCRPVSISAYYVPPVGYLIFRSNDNTVHPLFVPRWVLNLISSPIGDPQQQSELIAATFSASVMEGYVEAASYFLEKVNPDRRKELVKETTLQALASKGTSYSPTILVFLLSQMAEEELNVLFRLLPKEFLLAFLERPFYTFFFELCDRMWDIIPPWMLFEILKSIVRKIKTFADVLLFQNIFRELWGKTPVQSRSRCVLEFIYPCVLAAFNPSDRHGALERFCGNRNAGEKLRMDLLHNPNLVMQLLTNLDNINEAVKNLIQRCFPSIAEKDTFEEHFKSSTVSATYWQLHPKQRGRHDSYGHFLDLRL